MHLRAPRRGDARARADPAGRAAAAHDHARRRGQRPRHRVDELPQRAAARVGPRDGRAHRGAARSSRPSRATSSSTPSPTPTARSATRPGCGSSSSRCRRTSPCGTSASTTRPRSPRPSSASSRSGRGRGSASTRSTASRFAPGELYLTLARWTDEPGPTSDYAGQQVFYRSLQQREHRPAHHARLPLALGHRLVLVLARLRRPAPARAPAVAAAAGGAPTSTSSSSPSTAASAWPTGSTGAPAAPARARRPGRRGAGRAARRVPGVVRRARSACARCGCARCARASDRRLARPYPLAARRRPTSTSASGAPSTWAPTPRGPAQPGDRGARSPSSAATSRLYSEAFYDRRDVRPPLRRRPPGRGQGRSRPRRPTHAPSTTRWCNDDDLPHGPGLRPRPPSR